MRRRIMIGVALISAIAAAVVVARAAPPPVPLQHADHVFMIVLENEGADSTFGQNSEIPYLADTMRNDPHGEYLPNYYGIAHNSLPNYIAMVSGQPPSVQTQADCQGFTDFTPATPTDGIYVGQGCVFPPGVQTIATQLDGNGWSWKGYMQDMANSTPPEPAACRHPAANAQDTTQSARTGDQYAVRHNPFVYFRSLIESQVQASCLANDVDLSNLQADLYNGGNDASTTASFSFIVPDLCNDGHDGNGTPGSCADGNQGGMSQANDFLAHWVPIITGSPGFQDNGLLIVTFDEAEVSDSSACCNEQAGPNTPSPGALVPGPGGGRIGAVMMLAPSIDTPGRPAVDETPYNHYNLLGTLEDNFGLPRLGYARDVKPFGGFGGSASPPAQAPAAAPSKCAKAKKKKKHKAKHHASTSKKHKHKHKKHKKKSCKKKKKHKKHKKHKKGRK